MSLFILIQNFKRAISFSHYHFIELPRIMPKGKSKIDYSQLIERLTELDDDADFSLTKEQFFQFVELYPISKRDGFYDTIFRGLKDKKTNTVSFQKILVLYESTRTDFMNKPMLLIMFKGVASKHDKKLDLDEYLTIARLTQTYYNEDKTKHLFDFYDINKTGRISYHDVAESLFGIRVSQKENPFKEPIEVRSPHSGCCRI